MCPSDVPVRATGAVVVRPAPTPEELAAIAAALEVAWPRSVVVAAPAPERSPWRWSGRWWASHLPPAAERRRPH
jgi:hypothetical protein